MDSCNHGKAIEKINRANELIAQARAVLLPSLPRDGRSQMAADIFDEALQSLTAAVSELRHGSFHQPTDWLRDVFSQSDENRSQDSSRKRKSTGKRNLNESRQLQIWTLATTIPYVDGHQWRKYGQKQISKEKFLRNYYKCTNFKDQGCPARKTVQQNSGNEDPPVFTVSYIMQHSCSKIVADSATDTLCPKENEYKVSNMEHISIGCQENQVHPSDSIAQMKSKCDDGTLAVLTEVKAHLLGPSAVPDLEEMYGDIDSMFDIMDEYEGSEVDSSIAERWKEASAALLTDEV